MLYKKNLVLFALSLSAALLIVLNWSSTPAEGRLAIKDRDYQLVTGRVALGGEALYITDNRTGLMAVFTYDANVRGLRTRYVTSIPDTVFGK